MIDRLTITPLKIIPDDRGAVMHMLRAGSPHFEGFGEIYFSVVNPGKVKAWKRHTRMTLNLCCVSGEILLVVADGEGAVRKVPLGPGQPETYSLVTVPPGLWTGFSCTGDTPATLANCASIPHDPTEAESLPADTDRIGYRWP